jgi:hypothetical protein
MMTMTQTTANTKKSLLGFALGTLMATSLTGTAEAGWSAPRCKVQCSSAALNAKNTANKTLFGKESFEGSLNDCAKNCDNTKIMDILVKNKEKLTVENKERLLGYQNATEQKSPKEIAAAKAAAEAARIEAEKARAEAQTKAMEATAAETATKGKTSKAETKAAKTLAKAKKAAAKAAEKVAKAADKVAKAAEKALTEMATTAKGTPKAAIAATVRTAEKEIEAAKVELLGAKREEAAAELQVATAAGSSPLVQPSTTPDASPAASSVPSAPPVTPLVSTVPHAPAVPIAPVAPAVPAAPAVPHAPVAPVVPAAPTPPTVPSASGGAPADLLASIQAGKQLKKASDRDTAQPKEVESKKTETTSMQDELKKRLAKRHDAIAKGKGDVTVPSPDASAQKTPPRTFKLPQKGAAAGAAAAAEAKAVAEAKKKDSQPEITDDGW